MQLSSYALVISALASLAAAQGPPSGYYDSVDPSTPSALRQTLHLVIDDHTRVPYTSGAPDTWDVLEQAQEDPASGSRILDVYRNASYLKQGGGNSLYNREHTWPNSYGFPNDGPANYPYTDCHQLFLCDIGYNSTRGSKAFRNCSAACTESATLFNNGQGGGSGVYPGNSNWSSGAGASGRFEVWGARRGDVARALLYLDVRYEGGSHGGTGANEPDLILTDDIGLIAGSQTGSNESVAYMGLLSTLLIWHDLDPVDADELARNDAVFGFQGNRNPFIDHPEWVECIFSGTCSGGMGGPVGTNYCLTNANSAGTHALISGFGFDVVATNDFTLNVVGLPPGNPGLFFFGPNAIQAPFGEGFRCVGGATLRLNPPRFANGAGEVSRVVDLMAPPAAGVITPGVSNAFQIWYRDAQGGPNGFNLSDGLFVTWQ